MDAKTAVVLLRQSRGKAFNARLFTEESIQIAGFIEQQDQYAELGRLAVEAIDIHADNVGCIGIMNADCPTDRRKCGWYGFCQKRAELQQTP